MRDEIQKTNNILNQAMIEMKISIEAQQQILRVSASYLLSQEQQHQNILPPLEYEQW